MGEYFNSGQLRHSQGMKEFWGAGCRTNGTKSNPSSNCRKIKNSGLNSRAREMSLWWSNWGKTGGGLAKKSRCARGYKRFILYALPWETGK